MTFRLSVGVLLALVSTHCAGAAPAGAQGTLRVCLDQNIPPLSSRNETKASGFDLAVARAVASRLGRELTVQWFESEVDRDSNPTFEANALLSDGRCQLLAGYPLVATALGKPKAERARLPDYEGAKPADRQRWVQLNEVVASRGYRFAPLAVVLGPTVAGLKVSRLNDLKDLALVVEEGTLADVVLMTYGRGVLIDRITHIAPREALFERMEQGDYDATLVDLHRLDAYRSLHPGSKLSSSGHYHSIGFNIGFVALSREASLIAELNAVIGEMLATQELPSLAQESGLTYLPPRQPEILTTISREQLRGD